jgi:HK97 family phage major capsid protein
MEPYEAKEELNKLAKTYARMDVPTDVKKRTKELLAIIEKRGGRGPVYLPDPSEPMYRAGGRSYNETNSDGAVMPVGNRSYRSMFHGGNKSVSLDSGGFRDDLEFFNAIKSGRYDPRLQELQDRAQISGTPSQGGFSVPDAFASIWLDSALPGEIVRNRAKIFPMTTETLKVPGWDASDFSAGAYAGLTMSFLAEGASASKQTAKLRQIQLNANLAGIYVDSSLEVIADGAGFAEQLRGAMIDAIGYGIDRYCLGSAGTGSGCPLSVQNCDCRVGVSGETGQASSTITYDNIRKIFARQLNPERAIWVFNFAALPALLELSIAIGTAGTHVPLLDSDGNGGYAILGRKAIPTSHLPTIGNANTIMFIDWDFYLLGMRAELIFDETDSHRWLTRERSYRVLIRFDGQSSISEAVVVENGDSLSPIVGIEAI